MKAKSLQRKETDQYEIKFEDESGFSMIDKAEMRGTEIDFAGAEAGRDGEMASEQTSVLDTSAYEQDSGILEQTNDQERFECVGYIEEGSHVYFKCKGFDDEGEWQAGKRYTDFVSLRKSLELRWRCIPIPLLPPKHKLINQIKQRREVKQRFLIERRYFLNRFLKKLAGYTFITSSAEFKVFSRNQPQIRSNPTKEEYRIILQDHEQNLTGGKLMLEEDSQKINDEIKSFQLIFPKCLSNLKTLVRSFQLQMNAENNERQGKDQFFKMLAQHETDQQSYSSKFIEVLCDVPEDNRKLTLGQSSEQFFIQLTNSNPYYQLFNWAKGEINDLQAVQLAIIKVKELDTIHAKFKKAEIKQAQKLQRQETKRQLKQEDSSTNVESSSSSIVSPSIVDAQDENQASSGWKESEELLTIKELIRFSRWYLVKEVIPNYKRRHEESYQAYLKDYINNMVQEKNKVQLFMAEVCLHPAMTESRQELIQMIQRQKDQNNLMVKLDKPESLIEYEQQIQEREDQTMKMSAKSRNSVLKNSRRTDVQKRAERLRLEREEKMKIEAIQKFKEEEAFEQQVEEEMLQECREEKSRMEQITDLDDSVGSETPITDSAFGPMQDQENMPKLILEKDEEFKNPVDPLMASSYRPPGVVKDVKELPLTKQYTQQMESSKTEFNNQELEQFGLVTQSLPVKEQVESQELSLQQKPKSKNQSLSHSISKIDHNRKEQIDQLVFQNSAEMFDLKKDEQQLTDMLNQLQPKNTLVSDDNILRPKQLNQTEAPQTVKPQIEEEKMVDDANMSQIKPEDNIQANPLRREVTINFDQSFDQSNRPGGNFIADQSFQTDLNQLVQGLGDYVPELPQQPEQPPKQSSEPQKDIVNQTKMEIKSEDQMDRKNSSSQNDVKKTDTDDQYDVLGSMTQQAANVDEIKEKSSESDDSEEIKIVQEKQHEEVPVESEKNLDQDDPESIPRTLSEVFNVDQRKLSIVINNALPDMSRIDDESKLLIEEESQKQAKQENPTMDIMNKEQISTLRFNLNNIIIVLKEVFARLDTKELNEKDLILAIGNTGSGKSTMFTSLVFGADALHLKTHEETITIKNPDGTSRVKKRKRRVIEQKDPEEINGLFLIGHSNNTSQTFMPHFYSVPKHNAVYADIAGLQDTNGNVVELVNCFIDKWIFSKTKRVKILVPLTKAQITESRGQQARDQIQVIQKICQADLNLMVESMQPLITKCSASEKVDLDTIRSMLNLQCNAELQTQKTHLKNQQAHVKDDDEEVDDMSDNFKQMEDFYQTFAFKLEIFDPLDRPIEDDSGTDQAIKIDELLKLISEMPAINGTDLQVPMSNKIHDLFQRQLEEEYQMCTLIAEQIIQNAYNAGQDLDSESENISKNVHVQNLQSNLQFFLDHQLIPDAQYRINKLSDFINNAKQLIEHTKEYEKLSKEGQMIHKFMEEIFLKRGKGNFKEFTLAIVNLFNYAWALKNAPKTGDINLDAEKDIHKSKAFRFLEDEVTRLSREAKSLTMFAYELRALNLEDQYNQELLHGQVTPPVMADIIMQNSLDSATKRMLMSSKNRYRLCLRQGQTLQSPKQNPVDANLKTLASTKDQDDYSSNLRLHLCPDGFQIECNDLRLVWLLNDETAASQSGGGSQEAQFVCNKHPLYNDQRASVWTLTHASDEPTSPHFFIEMPYGEKRPRLVAQSSQKRVGVLASKKQPPSMLRRIVVTTMEKEGYSNEMVCVWRLLPVV